MGFYRHFAVSDDMHNQNIGHLSKPVTFCFCGEVTKIGPRYTWVYVIVQTASLLFARRFLYFAQEIIILLFEFTKLHLAIHG